MLCVMGNNTYTKIDISNWDVSKVTSMNHIFHGSSRIKNMETYIFSKMLPILDLDYDDIPDKNIEYIKHKIDKLKNMSRSRDGRITSSIKDDISNIEIGTYTKNKDYLQEEILKLLGISEEEMWSKDEAWLKGKIREFKIKMLDK